MIQTQHNLCHPNGEMSLHIKIFVKFSFYISRMRLYLKESSRGQEVRPIQPLIVHLGSVCHNLGYFYFVCRKLSLPFEDCSWGGGGS